MANLQLCIIINLKTNTLYTNLFTNWGDKLFKCILLIIWEFFSYLYYVIVQTAGKYHISITPTYLSCPM